MPDRPLILFPRPADADKESRQGGSPKFSKPTIGRQMQRLEPKFIQLMKAFDLENIRLQQSPAGINPEYALVFEIIGSVNRFYNAISKIEGFDWMFEIPLEHMVSDEVFFPLDKSGQRKEGDLSGKIYCIMTNRRAIEELLSLWRQYERDNDMVFPRGITPLRDVFLQLRDIRYWSAKDRIEETGVMEYWQENLTDEGTAEVIFEIELFYRKNPAQQNNASLRVRSAINELNGYVLSECVITDIAYHCILASLQRNQIQILVDNYEDVTLVKVEEIMFFRPVGQIAFPLIDEIYEMEEPIEEKLVPGDEPIVAILDGYPMANHTLLYGRLIIDDPDNWETGYLVKDRNHGTAMASLVIYGDYSINQVPGGRKVYIRPIYRPVEGLYKNSELVPKEVILVDLIHRAVKRIFEGERESPPVATSVKLINLSLGDPNRQFVNMISPLARLLDWLSYKYKVLFIISAGNHNVDGLDCGIDFNDFRQLSYDEREQLIIQLIERNSRNMRLLSPAESINSLSIGALFEDGGVAEENDRFVLPYHNPLPSPISAIGLGHNRSIKPDIFYNGGRKFLSDSFINRQMNWVGARNPTARGPGCLVAVPGNTGDRSYKAYTFGTSDAAAQVSHEGARCFDVLEDIFTNHNRELVPDLYAALLIKAMLVHGASWGENGHLIVKALNLTGGDANRIFRWIGNGSPDISRVRECAKNRITLIGYGSLVKDKAQIYQLPLPFDFSSARIYRQLTVTLSYFSPIEPSTQKYRTALLWFSLENNVLVSSRVNTDVKAVRRGTVQHEIFYGDKAMVWDVGDSIGIKINCVEDAGKLTDPIPYSVLVTFEIAEELDIDVYTDVATKIREMIPVTAGI